MFRLILPALQAQFISAVTEVLSRNHIAQGHPLHRHLDGLNNYLRSVTFLFFNAPVKEVQQMLFSNVFRHLIPLSFVAFS
jgi:hypothetical protein